MESTERISTINRKLQHAKIGNVHNVQLLAQQINQISQSIIVQQKLDFRIKKIHIIPIIGYPAHPEKFSVTIQAKSTVPSLSNLKVWMDIIKAHLAKISDYKFELIIHMDYHSKK